MTGNKRNASTTPSGASSPRNLEMPSPQIDETQGNVAKSPSSPANWPPIANPFNAMYPSKAGEFMFKQFEGFKDLTLASAKSGLNSGEKTVLYMYEKIRKLSKQWFTHVFLVLILAIYTLAGAWIFVAIEGPLQDNAIADIRELKRNFSEQITNSALSQQFDNNITEWSNALDMEMNNFIEGLVSHFKNGYFDQDQTIKPPTWSFANAMFYCGTIYTTIGYGHISPSTDAGRAVTIGYAIIGIPIFLILMADFGTLFTRSIKLVWAYVRRLYYTGSFQKIRKQTNFQEVVRGMNKAYELATFNRPDIENQADLDVENRIDPNNTIAPKAECIPSLTTEVTPDSLAPEDVDAEDEFNLPVSLAFVILLIYIFCGAAIYSWWENWSFFESCYFVFISMSTIGFGDYVPKHPLYMMASIIYLLFGLALTSMCINVIQVKLTNSFRQASSKIRTTIGIASTGEACQSQNSIPIVDDTSGEKQNINYGDVINETNGASISKQACSSEI